MTTTEPSGAFRKPAAHDRRLGLLGRRVAESTGRAPRARLSRSTQWDEAAVVAVVTEMAKRKMELFAAFKEFELADLISEGLIAARKAWPTYNPAKASASTFIGMVTARRVIDLWRTRIKRARREACIAISQWAETTDDAERADGLPGADRDDATLEDWVSRVYQACRRIQIDGRFRQGRKSFRFAQVFATALLMTKLKLTCRGAAAILADQPSLRDAMDMESAPSYFWCHRAREVITKISSPQALAASVRPPRRRRIPVCATQESQTNSEAQNACGSGEAKP